MCSVLCCFVFSGCNKDNIYYTAEKPVFQFKSVTLENYVQLIEDGEMYWTLEGCDPIKHFSFFKNFSEYYRENLTEDNAYLLYRDNENPPLTPYDEGSFSFYREKESGKLIMNESYDYYDSALGTKPYKGKIPYNPVSLYLDIYIRAVDKADLNGLLLEFGKLENRFYSYDKYINIYIGEECFATCYYNNQVNIPREWFENYFKTNLIYTDDL